MTGGRGLLFDGDRLWGLDPSNGKVVWRISLRTTESEDPQYSPFVSAKANDTGPSASQASGNGSESGHDHSAWSIETKAGGVLLHDFSGQLWRVDATEGRVMWTRSSDWPRNPEDGLAPQASIVGQFVIFREGEILLVLDESTGDLKRSIDASITGHDWPRRPLVWDDQRILVISDRLTVSMIDLVEGKRVWEWKATTMSPRNGPPRLLREGDKLLAIRDGDMAVRLDPATGKPLWDVYLGETDHSRDLPDIALDDQKLYVLEPLGSSRIPGVITRAYDLTDGSVAWRSVHISAGHSWAVKTRVGTAQSVLVLPDHTIARQYASGSVQSAETLTAIPAGTVGETVAATTALLDRSTGRTRWRYASPVGNDMPWTVADAQGHRLVSGSYREPVVSLTARER
jgi:outer membrane protein assembly factor BamB